MASNFAARAAVSGDLVNFRALGDLSRLGLAIQHPVTVYTARINQTFSTLDGVAELTYDGGSGTLADVLAGMTLFIGSSAGAKDKGICRVRKLPTATVLYINQTSKINFEEDDYLTVVNEFALQQRDLTQSAGIIRMDYDIDFGSFQSCLIVPRIAPLVAVLHLADGVDDVVTFTPPDPSLSACYDGATVASYLYDAPGAATTADMDTNAPSWTYDTAGEYRWSCTITDSNGTTFTSYRWVFVDPASIPFKFEDCGGDLSSGDWSFSFTCYDDVAKTEVYDRALVTLYSTDYYGAVKGSVGKIEGYENIWASGWIDGDSTAYDSETGEVTFTVRGPAFWESKLRANPISLTDVSGAPAAWGEITEMTADKAMALLLLYTSTAPMIMDCFFTGDTTRQKIYSLPGGNLLDQLNEIAGKIFAAPLFNNYGQMYVEVDSQLISSADRASLPVVMDITKPDRKDGLDIDRNQEKVAMVELGANSYDGAALSPIFSRAPGNTGGVFGDIDPYDDYMIVDQDECNRIAGCLLAMRNNEYESLEIIFPYLIKLFDICPRMVATITVSAADNPRGIALTSARLIPRSVKYVEDESGVYSTAVAFEIETSGVDGVTYIPPAVVDNGIDDFYINDFGLDDFGDFGDIDFPNSDLGSYFPGTVPTSSGLPPTTGCDGSKANSFSIGGWDVKSVEGNSSTRISRLYYPCKIRAASALYDTVLGTGGKFFGDASTHYAVYGIKNGARVITGTPSGGDVHFSPISDTDVDGFELEIEAGLGSNFVGVAQEVVASGTVQANDATGIPFTAVVDQYYATTATGLWWSGIGYAHGVYLTTTDIVPASGTAGIESWWKATSTTTNVTVADFAFGDNWGESGYVVRNAIMRGRQIDLGNAVLLNVCGAG